MKKEALLYGAIGLLVGVIITWGIATLSVNNNFTSVMKMMGMNNDGMSMSQMLTGLQGKTGDDFDKAFLSEMIMHHQGAIDMANLAQAKAKHQEVKTLANDILSAQSKEIDMMQTWQTDWGYKATPQSHMMTH